MLMSCASSPSRRSLLGACTSVALGSWLVVGCADDPLGPGADDGSGDGAMPTSTGGTPTTGTPGTGTGDPTGGGTTAPTSSGGGTETGTLTTSDSGVSGASGASASAGDTGTDTDTDTDADTDADAPDTVDDGTMTFFVTSVGSGAGGNFGGLAGADMFCAQLATAASPDFARRAWRAYLSTTTENARDRIGTGPWRGQDGELVANDLDQLHTLDGGLDATWAVNSDRVPLDENGVLMPTGVHDVLTGSNQDGTLATDLTCQDWTSADGGDQVQIGHSNRAGLANQDASFNSVHAVGCAEEGQGNVTQGGGRGSIYCFAVIDG